MAAGQRGGGILVGLMLVVIGGWWLAGEFFDGLGTEAIPLLIGLVFLALYFYNRVYGLLVAGGILTGIGIGQVADSALGPNEWSQIGLALGFLTIYVIDWLYRGSTHWWPLIPGGILLVTGLASFGGVMDYVWAVLLIAVGLVVIVREARTRGKP